MAHPIIKRIARRLGRLVRPDPKPDGNVPVSAAARDRIQSSLPWLGALRNKYAGRRGFVLGNGPSLRFGDLEKLKHEITIASNKVYLAFPQTGWRPTFHTVADNVLWLKIQDEIPPELRPILINHSLVPSHLEAVKTVRLLRLVGEKANTAPGLAGIDFSADLGQGAFGSCTVTYENLQLAVHLGLNPIYILGCDHKYSGETNVQRDKLVAHGNEKNHFIEGYRKPGELVNPAPIDIMNRGYREARRFSDASGIRIFNATRGGYLEAFERVDFDSLF